MKFKALLMVVLGAGIGLTSCQDRAKNEPQGREQQKKVFQEKEQSDILTYKVKEEYFNPDQLGLKFQNVYLKQVGKEKFKLTVKAEYDSLALAFHNKYYLILAIYPFDHELDLLDEERRKYGFEMFSVKIRRNEKNQLVIHREVKTKIRAARAITLSVVAYESKEKSLEIVMQNVKF